MFSKPSRGWNYTNHQHALKVQEIKSGKTSKMQIMSLGNSNAQHLTIPLKETAGETMPLLKRMMNSNIISQRSNEGYLTQALPYWTSDTIIVPGGNTREKSNSLIKTDEGQQMRYSLPLGTDTKGESNLIIYSEDTSKRRQMRPGIESGIGSEGGNNILISSKGSQMISVIESYKGSGGEATLLTVFQGPSTGQHMRSSRTPDADSEGGVKLQISSNYSLTIQQLRIGKTSPVSPEGAVLYPNDASNDQHTIFNLGPGSSLRKEFNLPIHTEDASTGKQMRSGMKSSVESERGYNSLITLEGYLNKQGKRLDMESDRNPRKVSSLLLSSLDPRIGQQMTSGIIFVKGPGGKTSLQTSFHGPSTGQQMNSDITTGTDSKSRVNLQIFPENTSTDQQMRLGKTSTKSSKGAVNLLFFPKSISNYHQIRSSYPLGSDLGGESSLIMYSKGDLIDKKMRFGVKLRVGSEKEINTLISSQDQQMRPGLQFSRGLGNEPNFLTSFQNPLTAQQMRLDTKLDMDSGKRNHLLIFKDYSSNQQIKTDIENQIAGSKFLIASKGVQNEEIRRSGMITDASSRGGYYIGNNLVGSILSATKIDSNSDQGSCMPNYSLSGGGSSEAGSYIRGISGGQSTRLAMSIGSNYGAYKTGDSLNAGIHATGSKSQIYTQGTDGEEFVSSGMTSGANSGKVSYIGDITGGQSAFPTMLAGLNSNDGSSIIGDSLSGGNLAAGSDLQISLRGALDDALTSSSMMSGTTSRGGSYIRDTSGKQQIFPFMTDRSNSNDVSHMNGDSLFRGNQTAGFVSSQGIPSGKIKRSGKMPSIRSSGGYYLEATTSRKLTLPAMSASSRSNDRTYINGASLSARNGASGTNLKFLSQGAALMGFADGIYMADDSGAGGNMAAGPSLQIFSKVAEVGTPLSSDKMPGVSSKGISHIQDISGGQPFLSGMPVGSNSNSRNYMTGSSLSGEHSEEESKLFSSSQVAALSGQTRRAATKSDGNSRDGFYIGGRLSGRLRISDSFPQHFLHDWRD
ncbi:hypothetical protein HNY73_014276 [Argiope bruennichi]|uniref:Uncharacterized protein n=1 Tax=Argiope bruennichi TaxID=94029 RepID=A0A8T0EPK7_ARGBR|nr:hypothetical protein HNY73_014276 [Argiope bruennichi]